ncbi:hypothetical protein RRG08_053156 [Elysia crispata]|uniref:Uncharacterized protein n=1 Tax=Elysia crispata TaxID=231223 RepID=A0AAE1EER9_9GAST|nr:hypothetical protein RRG08_053156 [Elysia crispata]
MRYKGDVLGKKSRGDTSSNQSRQRQINMSRKELGQPAGGHHECEILDVEPEAEVEAGLTRWQKYYCFHQAYRISQ